MSRIAYFECREDNHDKFYLMTEDPTGTTFVARWGRIGTEGSFCAYSISNWNKKLHERLSHGYVDRTQDYLRGYATVAEKANVKEGTLVEGDTYYIQS